MLRRLTSPKPQLKMERCWLTHSLPSSWKFNQTDLRLLLEPILVQKEVLEPTAASFLLTNPNFSKMEVV